MPKFDRHRFIVVMTSDGLRHSYCLSVSVQWVPFPLHNTHKYKKKKTVLVSLTLWIWKYSLSFGACLNGVLSTDGETLIKIAIFAVQFLLQQRCEAKLDLTGVNFSPSKLGSSAVRERFMLLHWKKKPRADNQYHKATYKLIFFTYQWALRARHITPS